jgi:hypothetical protein
VTVDTLSLARELRAADLAQPQAEAIAAAIGRAVTETAATRADLAQLRSEMAAMHAELKGGIDALRAETKTNMAEMKASILTWFVGTQIALGAILIAALKL